MAISPSPHTKATRTFFADRGEVRTSYRRDFTDHETAGFSEKGLHLIEADIYGRWRPATHFMASVPSLYLT